VFRGQLVPKVQPAHREPKELLGLKEMLEQLVRKDFKA
jgi:hypothetical protein